MKQNVCDKRDSFRPKLYLQKPELTLLIMTVGWLSTLFALTASSCGSCRLMSFETGYRLAIANADVLALRIAQISGLERSGKFAKA